MSGLKIIPPYIRYNPSPENHNYLVDLQAEKKKVGPFVGMDRIIDKVITEARKKGIDLIDD